MEYYNLTGVFFTFFFGPYVFSAVFGKRNCPLLIVALFAASATAIFI